MRNVEIAVLCILVFLAVSSGVTKVMLMPQDVDFFGKYGFSTGLVIAFGVAQLIGGGMMILAKTRLIGAVILAITFAISAVLLIMDGNVTFTIATFVALVFLGLVIRQSHAGPKLPAA